MSLWRSVTTASSSLTLADLEAANAAVTWEYDVTPWLISLARYDRLTGVIRALRLSWGLR